MKFILGSEEKTTQRITFHKPGDHEKLIKIDFEATFKLLSKEEFRVFMDSAQDGSDTLEDSDLELAKKTVTNLSGIFDDADQEIPFSEDLLESVMNDIHASRALAECVIMAHTKQGRKEAKRKN